MYQKTNFQYFYGKEHPLNILKGISFVIFAENFLTPAPNTLCSEQSLGHCFHMEESGAWPVVTIHLATFEDQEGRGADFESSKAIRNLF